MSNEMEVHGAYMPTVNIDGDRPVGRQLSRALNELLLELADMVDATFPPHSDIKSAEHILNYDAMRNAIGAVEHVLTVVPEQQAFRAEVLKYVIRAWVLTDGDPEQDEVVKRAINRAMQDYKPEVPEEKKRPGSKKRTGLTKAPTK